MTFVCVLWHTQVCRGQEGKKNCHDFIRLCRYWCQSLCAVSCTPGSPCMPCLEQPCLYCTLGYSCPAGLRPVSATHLAGGAGLPTAAHVEGWDGTPRESHLGLDRVNNGAGNSQPITAPKSLQLRLPHFITDTHTHSFPFTWVLLMDLGLGFPDNINGSRLTEVPSH